MRILFYSHYFPPEGNAPASRTYENARRWVEDGHQVTVVTCAPNVPDGIVYEGYRNRLRSQREAMDGIEVIRVWTWLAPNKGTVRRIANYLSYMFSAIWTSLFLKRPDVVLATSPQFFSGWAGVWVARFKRVPFILEIRDIWPESILALGAMQNRMLVKLLLVLEKRMYRAARHIVTVGEGYQEKLSEKGVPSEKISVVMNGIDRSVFAPSERDERLATELGLQGRFVCSYIGTIGMACGLEVVLDAAAILREQGDKGIAFLLVGDGASREALEEKAKQMDLDQIVFAGRRPKAEIPGFLALSDACLVHLKKTELFQTVMPSKIFEAAAMERPVINAVEGFAARFIETANAGINIPPENPAALVGAIERLRREPEAARAYGQSGRAYVLEHHDRDRLAERYFDIIKSQVDGRKAKQ